jgi:protein CpxP
MKIKSLLLLPGVLALNLSTTLPLLPAIAQTQPAPTVKQQNRANKLQLTDAQKAQLKAIKDKTTQRIVNDVLADAQRKTYNEATARGEKPRQVMRQFTFDDAQKQKLAAIRQDTKAAMDQFVQTLSPEQRQAWEARRDRMQSRSQRRNNPPQQSPQTQSL